MTAKQIGSSLPEGWRSARLGEVSRLNPTRPAQFHREDDAPTTFVPMPAVDEVLGRIIRPETKPFRDVRRGYTFFAEGDVLFAKITPCMQNGKHAIARGLLGGIGFGSTEFHVLRPGPEILAEWIYFYLRQPSVLAAAALHFTGAVGQQRVPPSFLDACHIHLPPITEQRRIAAVLCDCIEDVERARAAADVQIEASTAFPSAYLKSVFTSSRITRWPMKKLGDVLRLRKEVVHPRDAPKGQALFVGLEHIESGTGTRIGSISVEKAELTGRKPAFHTGDIVYGYLRPYLNKVWVADCDGLCSVDQYVYSLDSALASTAFIAWFMRSPVYLDRAPIDTTPGQLPRIRTEEVAGVQLHLPPVPEQQRIAAEIESAMNGMKEMRQSLREQKTAIEELPAALLRQAFGGRI